ncbi:MAG: hypothetical protein IJZ68_06520 [Bacteroidaceae bacterium]|nr:hypothetical protein [Bacteroidaceae bacterium]
MEKKFMKVLRGTQSSADPALFYKVDDVTIAQHWCPAEEDPVTMGGFSIATEKALIRWIFRGTVLYDVVIPDDAEIVYPKNPFVEGEIARVNKLILVNPRPMTDEIALQLYTTSIFSHREYYKILAGCAVMGYAKTCEAILNNHISPANAKQCLDDFAAFINPEIWPSPDGGLTYKTVITILRNFAQIAEYNK